MASDSPAERDPTLTLPAVKKQKQGRVTAVIAAVLVLGLLWAVLQDDEPSRLVWVGPAPALVGVNDALELEIRPPPAAGLTIESYALGPEGRASWRPRPSGGDGALRLSTQLARDLSPGSGSIVGQWRLVVNLVAHGPAAPPPQELSVTVTATAS